MKNYKTAQEDFWAGNFGKEYITRNQDPTLLASNINLFSKVIAKTSPIKSILEFGSNIGLNLLALKRLLPYVDLSAIEINANAVEKLKEFMTPENIHHSSILDYETNQKFDFVFSKGVLIHINPDELNQVYEKMYESSNRYICMIEYYNPSPVEINYRGHEGYLFKRDFAGELLEKYPDLELIDYGFAYRRDNNFPQDDLNWFLMEKKISLKLFQEKTC